MSESKTLLLDVLGTLVHDPFYDEVPRFLGMSLEEIYAAKHPTSWVDFESGRIDETAYLGSFWSDPDRPLDADGLVRCIRDAFRFLDGIEPLLADLAAAGVAPHLLSNYPPWWRWIEERLALSRYARWSFVSCAMGVRKPDPRAYTLPAERLGVPPSACVFVDDRPNNVEAAGAVGMDAILFEDAAQLRAALLERQILT